MTAAANEINEDDRTKPIGLFNYANSYWKSASELQKINIPNITHPGAPVDFLYVHAVELFLKSYIRLSRTVEELKDIGHRLEDLKKYSAVLFEGADNKYTEILDLIASHKINTSSRYICTGYRRNYPTPKLFEELCDFLHTSIKPKMIAAGY